MMEPTKVEELAVETLLGVDVPSREDMREVESTSQLYRVGDTSIMTIRILSVTARSSPVLIAVTFILTPVRLVILRYADPTPVKNFVARATKERGYLTPSDAVMSGLLQAIVGRVADILDGIGDELDNVSAQSSRRTRRLPRAAAIIFLPPTLIASVYGMNFEHMPELKWLFGYPFALGVMMCPLFSPTGTLSGAGG
jgi:Mg2+ and Co2+ transporter CorA